MMRAFKVTGMCILMTGLFACGAEEETEAPASDEEGTDEQANEDESADENSKTASVTLRDQEENEVGTAELEEGSDGVSIQLEASGMPENSEHGFHIHETGACEPPDFESAEDHFNPEDSDHGKDTEDGPHAGDLPNITTNENGEVKEDLTAENVTLAAGEQHSLLENEGTSLVIHEMPDDYESQPSGDAGDRLACGVIE
ncbi:superoxide dismutase family protein [Alteribacillus sp. HJP-4]|uniref:superoxide dismutase family protein n=1 Tax=Alteribacillus sp. HJP-4 TaxID=2775394 RepID=UPI0035CD0094